MTKPGIYKTILLSVLCTGYFIYSIHLFTNPSASKSSILSVEAEKGKIVWQENNCHVCHQLFGLGGYLGPDLTNVYQRGGSAYIQAMVKTGSKSMPAFKLTQTQLNQLSAFLEQTNKMGISDPYHYSIKPDGMITP